MVAVVLFLLIANLICAIWNLGKVYTDEGFSFLRLLFTIFNLGVALLMGTVIYQSMQN